MLHFFVGFSLGGLPSIDSFPDPASGRGCLYLVDCLGLMQVAQRGVRFRYSSLNRSILLSFVKHGLSEGSGLCRSWHVCCVSAVVNSFAMRYPAVPTINAWKIWFARFGPRMRLTVGEKTTFSLQIKESKWSGSD